MPSTNHAHNQQIRLHQDQAAFTSCLAFLHLTDIIHCLQVCNHWHTTLTTENQYGFLAWSSCTYTPERQLHLSRVYHPFIRSLHLIQMAPYLTVDALAAFTHLTSFSLRQVPDLFSKPDASADWEQATPQGLNTLFGLAPANTSVSIPSPAIHHSPILSFHLNWYRHVTHRFPLHRVLENPRFASLQELSILRPGVQPKEAILAIGRLKELTKLTCHVQLNPRQDDQLRWDPNLIILFEVIHQLPLLHTLNVNKIPEGILPLPSTITDLTISDLSRDPTPLFPALSSLTQVLKSFAFGTYKPSVPDRPNRDWSDFMNWLSEIKTLEVVRISTAGDHLILNLIKPYLLTTQLSIRLIRSHEGGISEMEFIREVNPPPLETNLPLVVSGDQQPPLQSPKSEPFTRHPLQHFRDWPMQSLKELYLVNLPLTSTLMECLSHLSSSNSQSTTGLEHLELTVCVTESVTPAAEVVTRFCEFLGQHTRLRTLVLHGRWIHQYSRQLSGALVRCQELRNVQLNSALLDCDGGCTFNLAEALSRLPHLAQLHLRGPCLGHITNLKVLVTSNSLHQLDCVLFSHPNPAMDCVTNTHYLLSLCDSHPHIQITVNGRPIRRMAATLAKTRQKTSSSKWCCRIQ